MRPAGRLSGKVRSYLDQLPKHSKQAAWLRKMADAAESDARASAGVLSPEVEAGVAPATDQVGMPRYAGGAA